MDELLTGAGAGGGGILGAFFAWLGFKSKICNIERRLTSLSNGVQYKDTCIEIHKAIDQRLENIENMQKETRDDMKELLKK